MAHKIDRLYVAKNKYVPENDPNAEAYIERIRMLREQQSKSDKKKHRARKRKKKKREVKKRVKNRSKKENVFLGSYKNYMKSGIWRSKRKEALRKDDYKCVICEEGATVVHHWYYTLPYGKEKRHQLGSMCDRCHMYIHDEHDDSVKSLVMFDDDEVKDMIFELIKLIRCDLSEYELNDEFLAALGR